MATVYSLICFGGKDGKTVTFTDAGDVVNLTNHGLWNATPIVFTDNGGNTLPTGLSKNTTYYSKEGADANKFTLYTAADLVTQVTFTGTGTGTHKVKSRYYYDLSDKSRWTYGGTEYIYESLTAWNTGRAGASVLDAEVCEIGMSWKDINTVGLTLSVPSTVIRIETKIDGVRTTGFHNGIFNSGYTFHQASAGANGISTAKENVTIDGIAMTIVSTHYETYLLSVTKLNSYILNNIIQGSKGYNVIGTVAAGIYVLDFSTYVINNIVTGCLYGIRIADYKAGGVVANNTFTYNGTGVYGNAATNILGYYYNNISVGNTTNWRASTTGQTVASNNAGLTGEAWITGSNPRITMATTDFLGYADTPINLRPALISSPQVETGTAYYGIETSDITDTFRPSYTGANYGTTITAGSFVVGLSYTIVAVGTTDFTLIGASASTIGITFKATGVGTGTGTASLNAVYDIGAFEFDLGYGSWPLVRSLDFSGLVAGSQVIVYTTATTTELFRDNNCSTTESYDAAADGVTVDYTILKTGYAPIRVTGVALTATSTPITINQQLDRAYATPSGLTFGTNVIVNVSARVVTSLQVTTATTVQNWYSYLMDSWIASATNTTLKNCAFPVIPFGEASFTTINGIEFSDGATSISKFSRDGFRYSSDAGVTATAIWAAILTLNTPAGQQVKYRQATAGSIVNAANTGPMDQLVQVYGDASHGNYDYRGHMVLRAPKVGWSQPQPDVVATYGNLVDGLFVAALEPLLQYATTDADIDAANLVLNNTTKTYTITAAHTMLELYQRAQWWANQDAQWDSDIPLTTTDGSTFTQPSTWALTGVSYLTAGTLSGGSATLAAGTQGIAYSGVTMNLGAAGTYTFTMAGSCTVKVTPTAPSNYVFGSGTFNGTLTVNNMAAHAITIEIPAGVTTSTAGNTGGAITFVAPVVYSDISITSMPTAGAASRRLQIINTTAVSAASRANSTAYALDAIRLRQTGIGSEQTAGLYLRCTTAGTSAGSPPTWNTTPGGTTTDGTAVWTTYAVLYYDADPASATLTDTYIDGEEFLAGETVTVRFAEMDAATSFKIYSTAAIATASGFSVLVAEEADEIYATFGLDGSAYESTFSPNFTSDYIVLDSNTDFSGKAAFSYYCYTLTTSQGMYEFWGGVTAIDAGNIRINSSVLNLYFDESAGFVKQTDDVRIFRADGTRPALDPTTGGNGIEINWRTPVSVVTTGGSALTAPESAQLMALPSSTANATAVLAAAVDGATTLAESIRLHNAVLAGKVSGAGTGTEVFRDLADTKARITATVDASGNRTAITRDAA